MRLLKKVRVALLIFVASIFPVANLYSQDSTYFISTNKILVSNPPIAKAIERLRGELQNKFALDFLLAQTNEYGMKSIDFARLRESDTAEIALRGLANRNVIESFSVGPYYFTLFKVSSLDGKQQYSMIADSIEHGGATTFHLFKKTANDWIFCDSFVLGYRFGGEFKFLTLNKCPVIRIRRPEDATGYYREDEAYLGIVGNRFKTLFGFKRIEFGEDLKGWIVGRVTFVDLNNDGLTDIVHRERVEIPIIGEDWGEFASTKLWLRVDDSNDFFKMKTRKIFSDRETKYLWSNTTLSFDQIQ